MDGRASVFQPGNRCAEVDESGLAVDAVRDLNRCLRLAGAMGPAGARPQDNKSGPAQVVGEPLGREARGEIPAAAAGLATLVKAQGVAERLGNFLRRCGGEVSYGWLRWGLVGHRRRLDRTTERNKNNNYPQRHREAACRMASVESPLRFVVGNAGWVRLQPKFLTNVGILLGVERSPVLGEQA